MQGSDQVLTAARGSVWASGLDYFEAGGGCKVVAVQVNDRIFTLGQDDSNVIDVWQNEWNGVASTNSEPVEHHASNASEAFAMLNAAKRDRVTWECGGRDARMYTRTRPRVGLLQCSTCGDGADSRHADRHLGEDDD